MDRPPSTFAGDEAGGDGRGGTALNYATTPSYALTVKAGSSGGAATATVPVTNVDEAPGFGAASYAFSVAEDVQIATTIGSVTASDPEGGTVVYDVTAGNEAQRWAVDPLKGAVLVGTRLSHAVTPSYSLTIRAGTLEGVPSATTTVTVTQAG